MTQFTRPAQAGILEPDVLFLLDTSRTLLQITALRGLGHAALLIAQVLTTIEVPFTLVGARVDVERLASRCELFSADLRGVLAGFSAPRGTGRQQERGADYREQDLHG